MSMRHLFSRRGRRPFEREPGSEVADELAFHLEERVRDYVARGMDPVAARAKALERFGDLTGVRTECTQLLEEDRRAADRRDWLDDLRQDLRYGVRSALRTPLFSLLAVATLALGIGANAAVFGVVKSVLLDALPYHDADRLVRVFGARLDEPVGRGPISPGTVTDIAARQRSFVRVAAFADEVRDVVYTGGDEARVLKAQWIDPAFLRTLGVAPLLGRPFDDADAKGDTVTHVILSYGAWQRLLGGDAGVVGRVLQIENAAHTVVGVLPADFVGPRGEADVFLPLGLAGAMADPIGARGSHWLGMVGRLKPGVTADAARQELTAIAADLAREHPRDNTGLTVAAVPMRDALVGDTRTPLLVLMASALLVLLITCANLAGALLSRTISRRKEFAVRVALGAGQGRLVRQLLTESTVLALVGGVAGVLLAVGGLAALRGLASSALPAYASLALDPGALMVTFVLALATGLAFGVVPALSVRSSNPQGTLRDESRGVSESRGSGRLRGALVAGQMALCVSLLAGAGLLARSLWAISSAPIGFDANGVLTAAIQLPAARYPTIGAVTQAHAQLQERMRALPGVTATAMATQLPTAIGSRNGITAIEGQAPPGADGAPPFILYASVSDDYFRALRIPLKSGRVFGPQEKGGAAPMLVISESMARRYWPNGGAIGARLRMGPDPKAPMHTVIGVVGDIRNDPSRPEPEDVMYGSSRQNPWSTMSLIVRTEGDPLALVRPARRVLAEIDPAVPLHRAMTLRSLLADKLVGRRLPAVLMTAFGALALLLASVGVYAMFASLAAAREREFGIRVALGSTPAAVAALVLRQGGLWMAIGLAVGAGGVVLVTRSLRELLFGVAPFDPATLASALLVLLACAALALLGPVRRAARANPISILR